MRAMMLMLAALAVGFACGLIAARQFAAVRAYPRGVMAVLQQHVSVANRLLRRGSDCDAGALRSHLAGIERLTPELLPALAPGDSVDTRLLELARAFDAAARGAAAATNADCTALAGHLRDVEAACSDCHREYR